MDVNGAFPGFHRFLQENTSKAIDAIPALKAQLTRLLDQVKVNIPPGATLSARFGFVKQRFTQTEREQLAAKLSECADALNRIIGEFGLRLTVKVTVNTGLAEDTKQYQQFAQACDAATSSASASTGKVRPCAQFDFSYRRSACEEDGRREHSPAKVPLQHVSDLIAHLFLQRPGGDFGSHCSACARCAGQYAVPR